jgi:predicted flavoprotein YhiN
VKHHDVIIIGAGAAGLMCAATAGYRGRDVLVLDNAKQAGKKILISGGGRCNFTNQKVEPQQFICGNPHFVKSALARYRSSVMALNTMNAITGSYFVTTQPKRS